MVKSELLRRSPLFAGLSDEEIALVAQSARQVQYPRKSIVFHEGDPGDHLLVITRGRVKVLLSGDQGQETIVAILDAPAFLGEMALLAEAPRSATVMTLENTEFIRIGRSSFLTLIEEHPAIGTKVLRQLAAALRDANEQIRTLSMFDAYGRVVRCLLGIARKTGRQEGPRLIVTPKPSFQELARMIGCSRETVSRAIKTLQDTGYVSVVERGLALEARAVRRYLEPSAFENLSPDTSGVPAPRVAARRGAKATPRQRPGTSLG
jgi:CRP-like cAMP-binding protein